MNEKVLLVIGASSDIGMSLIDRISKNYDYIIGHYNNINDKLSNLKNKLGDKLILIQGDFSKEEATKQFIEDVKLTKKMPTHIVHLPARKMENIKFSKLEWKKFETEINISLRSLVMILLQFLPNMAKNKQGKVVVMLTSCTTNIPPKYLANYVTVKYALLGLVKALSAEYCSKGVMVNGVSPSMVNTKFLKDVPELLVNQNALNSPTGQNLSVDDVIPTFEFLLSDEASGITGQNIAITNGNIM